METEDARLDKAFPFLMVPWALITDPKYKSLSVESKLLYSLMLDRSGLSKKNEWFDKEGRVFIYYTAEEIMRTMGCARQKAFNLLRELKEYGLIECKRTGLNKPNRIFVNECF